MNETNKKHFVIESPPKEMEHQYLTETRALMAYRQRLLDRIRIAAQRPVRTAAELRLIAHRLNGPLLENAQRLIDKVDAGKALSDWEVDHLTDLHQRAQRTTKITTGDSEMAEFEVWTEGYGATGGSSGATFHGKFDGETFKDAVVAFRDSLDNEKSRSLIDLKRMTYWACSFFDNEHDARKSFG